MFKAQTVLATASMMLISGMAMAQQCKNGVCTVPSHNDGLNRPWSPFDTAPETFDFSARNDATRSPSGATGDFSVSGRNGTTCNCRGGNCNCGPDYPQEIQPQMRQPEPFLSRLLPSWQNRSYNNTSRPRYPSGDRQPVSGFTSRPTPVQAPQPRRQQFAPVAYTPAIKWETDFRSAADSARQTSRLMLVKVGADWCGYCRQMKAETFTDARIIRDIDSDFIAVDLNADSNRQLLEQMNVRSLPTVLVITPDMRIVDRAEGFRSAAQLSEMLTRHMQRAQLENGVRVASR
ncbi:MAG: thioredoxin family protein [Fuerstiella sp.]